MDSVSIELWLDKRQLAALEQALTEDGTTVERTMQEQLNELYAQRVPLEQQEKIQQALDAERLECRSPHHGERAGTLSLHQKRPGIFGYGDPHATLCARHIR